MIGLLFGLLHLGMRFATGIDDTINESRRKNEATQKGYDFYVDRKGTKRRVTNKEPFYERWDRETGHLIEFNPYNGEVYRDVTAQAKNQYEREAKTKAITENKRFYKYEMGGLNAGHYSDKIKGCRYKDLEKPGEIYVCRIIYGVYWYLNIKTGMFECPEKEGYSSNSLYYINQNSHKPFICIKYNSKENIERIREDLNNRMRIGIERYNGNIIDGISLCGLGKVVY